MATVNFIPCKSQCRASLRSTMDYVRQDKKCISEGLRFVTGKDCCAETAYAEFMATKNSYGKAGGRFFYHYTQSFSPEEEITPAQAHRAALKLAKRYAGYEVLVATHCDAEHIHSHLVINSVSFADGKKLRQDPRTLERLRHISDGICNEMGLSTLEPYEQKSQAKTISTREFRAAEKGESWKFRLMGEIDQAMQVVQSPEDFIALMKRRGYGVRWEAGRKSITYTTPEGMKCRDNKLHETKYLKERMELEFGLRATEAQEQHRYAGGKQGLPAGELLDSERAVELNCEPADAQFAAAAGDSGDRGRTGGRGNHAPVLPGNEEILGGLGQRTEQPPEGDGITGWEDERAKFQMGQRFGSLAEEPGRAESEEFVEEDDLDFDGPEHFFDTDDDPSDADFEVRQWQMRF